MNAPPGGPDHQAIMDRLARGEDRFSRIESSIEKVLLAVEPIPDLKTSVDATKEIVEAWGAVKTGGKFIKWASGLLVACGAAYAVLKGIVTHVLLGGVR